ncbi:hypothetical protein ACVIVD_008829 [Bradyrhizobium liaoningense]
MDQQARQVADASASAGDVALHARWRGGRGRRRAGLDGVRGMGVPAPRRRSRRLQSRHRGVLGNRRHADAPQRYQRDAVDETGELRAAVRAITGRRSRPAALVHGLLRRQSFGFSSGRGFSPRMEPNTLCCGRSWSIASTTPVDPCYPRPGARWERSPSSKTPGATFQQPSRPSGSSGCLYASSAVRRPSAPSPWLRGPLVPFTIDQPGPGKSPARSASAGPVLRSTSDALRKPNGPGCW